MSISPNSDLPQRLPQANTLKRAGLFRISICPGWGILHLIVVDIFDAVGSFFGKLRVRRQIFKAVLQLLGLTEQGGKGVGELADGSAFMVAGLDLLHDVAGSFEHVLEQFEFEVGEVPVLSVFVLMSEFVFVGAPAS